MATHLTNDFIRKLAPQEKPFEVWDDDPTGLLLRVQPSGAMTYYVAYSKYEPNPDNPSGKKKRVQRRKQIGSPDVMTLDAVRKKARILLAEAIDGDPIERERREALEKAEEQARLEREKAEDQARHDQESASLYLRFLDEKYKPWLVSNLTHGEYAYTTLKKAFPELHALKLGEVTTTHIEDWRIGRLEKGISANTVNRQLSDLRACFNRAKDIWGLITVNPLDKVKPSKIDSSPKVRYLSEDEEAQLLAALDEREEKIRAGRDSGNHWRDIRAYTQLADLKQRAFADHLKPAVLLSLHTGLRRGELLKLKWENVYLNLKQPMITVVGKTSKTGKTRHVPLNAEALRILRGWKDQPGLKSQYVFTGAEGEPLDDMRTSWEGVLQRAHITNFRWHDLRHTFASKLVMAGVDLNTVRELMGHSDYKMTLRYAHLAPEHKAAAVAKLVATQAVSG